MAEGLDGGVKGVEVGAACRDGNVGWMVDVGMEGGGDEGEGWMKCWAYFTTMAFTH